MSRAFAAAAFAAAVLAPAVLAAGPERVAFPADYQTRFVRYNQIDRPDRNPPVVRFLYSSPEAFAAMRAGIPAPSGTVLVMENRKAALGPDGKPMVGPDGMWQAGPEILSVEVQEKRAGWGAAYPPDKRNDDWEYAAFTGEGKLRTEVKTDGCFNCHLNRRQRDFTFTFIKFFEDKGR
ncbi:MAG: cytochrome P460 family protein [Alphaproteobacteria bacterium]